MKKLYLLGLAMILLMISLPIAHAATLSVVTIAGQDQIENYYRSTDVVNIEVLAAVEGEDAVELDQLRVYVDDGTSPTYFQSCTPVTGSDLHRCVLQKDVFGQSGTHDFKIRLYTDGTKFDPTASPVREEIQQFTVDAIPPTISRINVIESFTDDPSITIEYDVRDTAIAGNSILCSGIEEIQLREDGPDGNLLATIPGDATCRMQNTYSLTLPGIDKEYTICLVATDFLGQTDTAPHCDTVTLDSRLSKLVFDVDEHYFFSEFGHVLGWIRLAVKRTILARYVHATPHSVASVRRQGATNPRSVRATDPANRL